ncbi:MAG: hypothetical protein PG981_000126 [Wolbachia endosymbiont of Ctenocephalides orientis wCori]|nr:MAG: hypothetical protein PG981_000126 [Wolbachia endosymbiont of Ctenocephalides orientis wCori]
MSNNIEFKQVTKYEVHKLPGGKNYRIVSEKSNSNENNYRAVITPESRPEGEKPTGLCDLHISKTGSGSGFKDSIVIKHLQLTQGPIYNELARTVNVGLDFAHVTQPTQVF